MKRLSSDDILLDRLLTLAWRAAQVGAVIEAAEEPNEDFPEDRRGRFRLAGWDPIEGRTGQDLALPGVNLDELERQIHDLEMQALFVGGAA